MVFCEHKTKADGEDSSQDLLRFVDENKMLKSFLRKADDAFNVDFISNFICDVDRTCGYGPVKCWDDDNTIATAYTNRTAYTEFTAGTIRTGATGGTFDSRETHGTFDTIETVQKDNFFVECVEFDSKEKNTPWRDCPSTTPQPTLSPTMEQTEKKRCTSTAPVAEKKTRISKVKCALVPGLRKSSKTTAYR